jgi:hypothetical protein
MPTAAVIDFWLAGWGTPNSLVPDDIDLIALADAGVDLIALPEYDGYGMMPFGWPVPYRYVAKTAQVETTGKTDDDPELVASAAGSNVDL